MKIGIGNDHTGVALKQEIIKHLEAAGHTCVDFGAYDETPVDYPDIAVKVAGSVKEGSVDTGIVICGTGIGISIACNKVAGIRCALCGDVFSAEATRAHNNANMLALGARVIGPGLALKIVDTFLQTPFSGEVRHQKRIDKLSKIEQK